MRRSLVISAVAVAVALALPAGAGAVPRQIDVDDDFFAPRNPPARNFQAGPSFRWTNGGGTGNEHNIRQDDRLFSSGALTDGPINFAIRASAGSFHYYCTLHRFSDNMAGRVEVRPIDVPDSTPGEADVRWASSSTNTGSRFDVRYRVDRNDWKIWRNDTSSFHGLFGHNNNPVNLRPSRHNYKIQVRSERKRVSKRSDWSPALRCRDLIASGARIKVHARPLDAPGPRDRRAPLRRVVVARPAPRLGGRRAGGGNEAGSHRWSNCAR